MLLILFFAINPMDYPNASGFIHLDSTEVILHKDGSVEKTRFLRIEILNHRGRDVFGDITERYDTATQTFEVILARTIQPDGDTLFPEKDAISEVSAPEVGFATQYTDVLMKVVSFPGLEPGSIIEYAYRVKSKGRMEHPLSGKVLFRGTEPIGKKVFSISFPVERHINYTCLNGDIPFTVDTASGKVTVTFQMENIPQFLKEENMPSISKISPAVLFSEFESIQEMGNWIYRNFSSSIETEGDVKKKAEELCSGDNLTTLKRVAEFIQKDVRSIPLYLWDAGYKPHKAGEVLKNMYGDPRDKGVLAVSLLKALNIEPEILLVSAPKGRYFSIVGLSSILSGGNEVYTPSEYTDIVVRVKIDTGYFYIPVMDSYSDAGYLPGRYQGEKANVPGESSYETALPLLNQSLSIGSMKCELDRKGNLKGFIEFTLTGRFSRTARIQMRDKKEKEREALVRTGVCRLSMAGKPERIELKGLDRLTEPVKGKIEFEAPDFAIVNGDEMTFVLPHIPFSFAGFVRYGKTGRRKFPVVTGSPGRMEYTLKIKLPENTEPVFVPEDVQLDNSIGRVVKRFKINGDTLIYSLEYILKKKLVKLEEYMDLKKLERVYTGKRTRQVILKLK